MRRRIELRDASREVMVLAAKQEEEKEGQAAPRLSGVGSAGSRASGWSWDSSRDRKRARRSSAVSCKFNFQIPTSRNASSRCVSLPNMHGVLWGRWRGWEIRRRYEVNNDNRDRRDIKAQNDREHKARNDWSRQASEISVLSVSNRWGRARDETCNRREGRV